jgi:hypothetical protein
MGKDHEPVVMLLLEDHKAMEKPATCWSACLLPCH